MKKRIGILGVTGYTGEELVHVLERHPNAELSFATSEQVAGEKLGNIFPNLGRFHDLTIISVQESIRLKADLVFLCLPAKESAKWGQAFYEKGGKVVDLGADFRFTDETVYQSWYKQDHPHPALLKKSVYGLPEWNRAKIKKADIVGNPGCYPTAILLAILPFLQAGIVAADSIIADAKSGISGAGKQPTKTTHFVEANENTTAYKVGRVHRHVGEMECQIYQITKKDFKVIFTPHLVPLTRGLYATVYFQLRKNQNKEQLTEILLNTYQNEPFIRVLPNSVPGTHIVMHSNFCFLSVEQVPGTSCAVALSSIDNLGKGASWQAVQNMNLMLGISEGSGLIY